MAPVGESIGWLDSGANCTSSPPGATSDASAWVIRLLLGETGGRVANSAGLQAHRQRLVSVSQRESVRRVHGLDGLAGRKMITPLAGVADELDRCRTIE